MHFLDQKLQNKMSALCASFTQMSPKKVDTIQLHLFLKATYILAHTKLPSLEVP